MRSANRLRAALPLPAAMLLSMALVAPTLAVDWSQASTFTSSGNGWAGGVAAVGDSAAAAVYERNRRIVVRRTSNSGATWSDPLQLANAGVDPRIAALGQRVDVVWMQNGRVRYARSKNGGASFGASMALSSTSGFALSASVARGPDKVVAVAWHDFMSDKIRVRVSKDSGKSFAKAKTIASTSAFEGAVSVAVGNGVIYVAYFAGDNKLRMRRSTDSGKTWATSVRISNNAIPTGTSLAAVGKQAYLAFTVIAGDEFAAAYRRTANRGKTWSATEILSDAQPSFGAVVSLHGGVARAAWMSCHDEECEGSDVYYRESSGGGPWTAQELVSWDGSAEFELPAGITYAGKVIVLSTTFSVAVGSDVVVRHGTP